MSFATTADLPPAEPGRVPLHTRRIEMQGWRRSDGMWDIEGELLDRKNYDYVSSEGQARAAGTPVHNMKIRLTVDAQMTVRAIQVAMPHTPFAECHGGAAPLQGLVGASLMRGWRKAIDEAAGGIAGCTHLRELLPPMATTAFQTVMHDITMGKRDRGEDVYAGDKPPAAFGQCIAWDFDGAVVKRVAPKFAGYRPPASK
ncbi:hypothetical protein H4CHR_03940 [Variovorax sp. PBS-H4]|uniref:DUF2889 domain-containing protein n=1 Tax=Variovorax sp. PBS-H4 TaxID=434008 RepID=UPI0013177F41|nr:DUF2889 domain-containing protein [Variovorax sp. PBS-H4]VTU36546.1 hypothetical protein H4CHR_03940 [Variovorax sp. PBS-H4]